MTSPVVSYGYPLTISDDATRYLLACEALSTTQERYAFRVFERACEDFGLPDAIRTDIGVPVRLGACSLRLEQTGRVVAALRHPARADRRGDRGARASAAAQASEG